MLPSERLFIAYAPKIAAELAETVARWTLATVAARGCRITEAMIAELPTARLATPTELAEELMTGAPLIPVGRVSDGHTTETLYLDLTTGELHSRLD